MIENQGVYLTVFLGFTLFMILIGVWASRKVKNGEDFLMGGRGLSLPLLIGTTVATLVGTGSSMGAVGFAFTNGWAGALYGIGGSIGMFGLLLLFADVRKYNFMTFSEELSFYYGANKIVKGFTSVLMYIASIGWLGAHILGGSLYLSWITGIDPFYAKIITAIGFALYTLIGGFLAVVYTDTIQGAILFLGFITLTILSVVKIGGLGQLSTELSTEMVSFLGIGKLGLIPAISLVVVIAVGVLATPSFRHRIYSSGSIKTVKKGFFVTGTLFAIFSLFPSVVGMSARVMNPGIEAGFAFPFLATEVFPIWVGAIVLVAGLSATMSSGSSDFITGVTILLRDVYQTFTGKIPKKENMVSYSRMALVLTLGLAFVLTLGTDNIIDYISNFIATIMSGLFIAAVLGKFWSRVTWQGGLASIIGGSLISFTVLMSESLTAFWGNPVLPSLAGALVIGVFTSLITPRNKVSKEEALQILSEERSIVDDGASQDESINSNVN
ncbi:sodium:solute symporter family protein [Alteribacillus bidgolensis]|uniref:Solute:Na+ symporter, SSS family n=1 Tax=Alteribacillus bidgolensis TaxID=930129 RepID=A0A1G8FQ03_9BACI|nr:sodium:solute symporter family protein [Alteribacillus bidgolensis]SDH84215.1 solute:Na+ symporter, SSS family [Alteribacillus bidgolensis]